MIEPARAVSWIVGAVVVVGVVVVVVVVVVVAIVCEKAIKWKPITRARAAGTKARSRESIQMVATIFVTMMVIVRGAKQQERYEV